MILVLLMFIGACAGSTGGGFKISRLLILCKAIPKQLSLVIHPREVKVIRMDGKPDRPQYTALYECVSGNLFFHPAGFHPFDQCG